MKPKPAPVPVGPMLPIGTKVAVLRPNLWAGRTGKVVDHKEPFHLLDVGQSATFHALATIEELKEIKE